MSYYFKTENKLKDQDIKIDFIFQGYSFSFRSNSGIFSKDKVDQGSHFLLQYLAENDLKGHLLDIGCGYGLFGVVLSKIKPELLVTMVDINERAVEMAKLNCQLHEVKCWVLVSNICENVENKFDYVISNPPIRAGKQVVFDIIKQAKERLNDKGQLFLVIRKKQGALSALNYASKIFNSSEIVERHKGYWIIKSIK